MAKQSNEEFSLGSVLARVAFSLALVYLTFNPSGHSYYHWLSANLSPIQPLVVIAGLLLLGGWIFFVNATFSSMGTLGVALLLALFASIVWWMVAQGWLSMADRSAMAWVVLTALGLLLGIGMSWAHIRARISGQASVDRVDT
jgi:drug/metabolite transporter (DMT)-like permease